MEREIDEPVEVVPYDENWPRLFHVERDRLHKAQVAFVHGIEHFGSTSVPGLAAKPSSTSWSDSRPGRHLQRYVSASLAWATKTWMKPACLGAFTFDAEMAKPSTWPSCFTWDRNGWPIWLCAAICARPLKQQAPTPKKGLVANGNVTRLADSAAKAPIVEELMRKSLSATL
jgi:hypothetical protein